ncbi:hypothetical protein VUR80DRAFT_3513 [Thermomyces stellatus]
MRRCDTPSARVSKTVGRQIGIHDSPKPRWREGAPRTYIRLGLYVLYVSPMTILTDTKWRVHFTPKQGYLDRITNVMRNDTLEGAVPSARANLAGTFPRPAVQAKKRRAFTRHKYTPWLRVSPKAARASAELTQNPYSPAPFRLSPYGPISQVPL